MILFLRVFFIVVLASMLAVTSWASWQCALFSVPRDVATHPWFIATLVDAYWGFLTFFVWVFYKHTARASRIAWLIAILLLGNIAMAVFCLNELFRTKPGHSIADVVLQRHSGTSMLGLGLAMLGIAVVGAAALQA